MNSRLLLDAISGHVHLLASYHTLMVTVAIVALYTVLFGNDDTVDLHFVKVPKEKAAGWLSILFYGISAAILIILLRLLALLSWLPAEDVGTAVTLIGTNRWLLNPFTTFGNANWYSGISTIAIMVLVFSWWISFIAPTFLPQPSGLRRFVRSALLFFLGLTNLMLVRHIANLLNRLLIDADAILGPQLMISSEQQFAAMLLSSFLGLLLLFVLGSIYDPEARGLASAPARRRLEKRSASVINFAFRRRR